MITNRRKLSAALVLALGASVGGVDVPAQQAPAPEARTDCHGDPLPAGAIARLGTIRFRHPNLIFALAYSPNGKVLAAADGGFLAGHRGLGWAARVEGSVCLWDPATGQPVRRWAAHKGTVRSLVFSADGRRLLTTGDDRVARLWDPATGKEIGSPRRIGASHCAALAPDGKTLAVGTTRGLHLVAVEDDKEIRQFDLAGAQIRSLVFAPDGKTLAGVFWVRPGDSGVCLWDIPGG
jgi:WD40 repeat protein